MGFVKEFKEFITKGNIIDLAVAVIIGAAFTGIISSLVDDIITPAILTPALKAVNAANISELKYGEIKYGNFLSALIKFLVIALVLFSVLKVINLRRKKEEAVAPGPTLTEKLLMEIRDSLKK